MNIFKPRNRGALAIGIALASFFAVSAAASAQYPNQYRGQRRAMVRENYERIRQYAHHLDELAQRAREQTHVQQGAYWGFRRDPKFLRSIDRFAERTSSFHERMDTYQTRPWAVDDEINGLLNEARNVQYRLRRASFVTRRTVADWNEVISVLNQMSTEYQAGIGSRGRWRSGDREPYPGSAPPPPGTYQEPNPNQPPPPDYRGNYRRGQGDLRQLAAELETHAARASQLAGGYPGFSPDVRSFGNSVHSFRAMVDDNRASRLELRNEVDRLLQDAQSAHQELTRRPGTVSREVADEWDGIVQVLNRMRDSI